MRTDKNPRNDTKIIIERKRQQNQIEQKNNSLRSKNKRIKFPK